MCLTLQLRFVNAFQTFRRSVLLPAPATTEHQADRNIVCEWARQQAFLMGREGIGITGGPGASNGMWAPGPHHHHAVGCIDSFFPNFFEKN